MATHSNSEQRGERGRSSATETTADGPQRPVTLPAPWLVREPLRLRARGGLRLVDSQVAAAMVDGSPSPAAEAELRRGEVPVTASVSRSLEVIALPDRVLAAWAEVLHHVVVGPPVVHQFVLDCSGGQTTVALTTHVSGPQHAVAATLAAAEGHLDLVLRAQSRWLRGAAASAPSNRAPSFDEGAFLGEYFTELHDASDGAGFFAWRTTATDLVSVADALALHPGAARLAVSLRPTALSVQERATMQQAGQPGHAGDRRGFEARVHLALSAPPAPGFVELLGARLFGRQGLIGALDAASLDGTAPTGAFTFEPARTAEQRRDARWNLNHGAMLAWEPGCAGMPRPRVSRLVTAMHALSVARLPVTARRALVSARPLPRPSDLPQHGASLGRLGDGSALRQPDAVAALHTHVVGRTGMGKSTLLLSLILQRIAEGRGVCVIDPHGELVDDVLCRLRPGAVRDRDVVVIDPTETERPVRLNLLGSGPQTATERSRSVDFVFSMLEDLYDMRAVGGPIFETIFRVGLLTILETELAPSITDFQRLLSDSDYRKAQVAKIRDPMLKLKWQEFESTSLHNDSSLENLSLYASSKLNTLLYNHFLRPMLAARRSSVNPTAWLDGNAIVLVSLRKGPVGGLAGSLLGRTVLSQLVMAAMKRTPEQARRAPFHVFVDEFQNVVSGAVAEALSEVRKYGLRLTLAHQHMGQLGERVSSAISGNIGTSVQFRVGARDAASLARDAGDPWLERALCGLAPYHAAVTMHGGAEPVGPVVVRTERPFGSPSDGSAERWREMSRTRFGRAVE